MNDYVGYAAILTIREYTPKEKRVLKKLAKEVMAFIEEQNSKNKQ